MYFETKSKESSYNIFKVFILLSLSLNMKNAPDKVLKKVKSKRS